jgi:hypothetical protein
MNEEALSETVQGAFADVVIGPPPLERMHTAARRTRRTRFVAVTSAAAAVVVVAGISTWAALHGDDAATDPATSNPAPPAAGLQYVGVDRVVVAVPESWIRVTASTDPYCGSRSRDVIAYNAPDCDRAHQDAVHFLRDEPASLQGWDEGQLDGETAYRSDVRVRFDDPSDGEPTVWTAQVYVDEVVVSVISSRSEDDAEALLDSVGLTSSSG